MDWTALTCQGWTVKYRPPWTVGNTVHPLGHRVRRQSHLPSSWEPAREDTVLGLTPRAPACDPQSPASAARKAASLCPIVHAPCCSAVRLEVAAWPPWRTVARCMCSEYLGTCRNAAASTADVPWQKLAAQRCSTGAGRPAGRGWWLPAGVRLLGRRGGGISGKDSFSSSIVKANPVFPKFNSLNYPHLPLLKKTLR